MDQAELHAALEAMSEAARAGGRVLVDAFAALDSLTVQSKGPSDFVSEADVGAEHAIRAVLQAADPSADWRGEETGFAAGTGTGTGAGAGASGREWVVDPLDGTTNFLCGIPHFAVSIALREAGEIVAGVIYQPLTDERFAAAQGLGATRNGAPIHVSRRTSWDQVVLATGVPHRGNPNHERFAKELAGVRDRVGGVRRFGSAALDLAWVAWGRFDGFWERRLQAWDVDAGIVLVREAGGVVSGLEPGHDPDTGVSVVAATPWLHPELVVALGGSA